jgi:hypothetical protein
MRSTFTSSAQLNDDHQAFMWRERIHWGWLPVSAVAGFTLWREQGWLPAVSCVAGGLGLGLFVRWRHRND